MPVNTPATPFRKTPVTVIMGMVARTGRRRRSLRIIRRRARQTGCGPLRRACACGTSRTVDASSAAAAHPAGAAARDTPRIGRGHSEITSHQPGPFVLDTGGAVGRPACRLVRAARPEQRGAERLVLDRGGRPARLDGPAPPQVCRRRRATHAGRRPAAPALPAGSRATGRVRLLGLLLAPGLRPRLAAGGAAPVRVRVRHAAVLVAPPRVHPGVRTVPDHFQHEPVSLVP